MEKFRYTEKILNAKTWVDGYGEILPIDTLEEEHVHNMMNFIYKNRDRYWMGCRDIDFIETFDNGDEFFNKVIRQSTLWNELKLNLKNEDTSFNFVANVGSRVNY